MIKLRDRIFTGRHFKLQALLLCIVGWCIGLFVYGLVTYTDAPYKLCGDGEYCGKTGVSHSYETYQDWKYWEALLFISWPCGMLAGFGLGRLRKQPS